MKTLAQLKRDAASGNMILTLIERFGGSDEEHIPERMKGARKVIGTNTVALKLLNHDGRESEMRFGAASLVEYTDNSLTIYNPGYRELSDHEKAILSEAERKVEEYKQKYPYNDTYWMKKSFFEKSDCPYLGCYETVKGCRYDRNRNMIQDKAIKGEAILKYTVSMA